jgi:hypothetical protein
VYDIWDKKENSRGQQRLSLPQRPERAGTRLILGAPDVIANQADVLPAERGDVAEQVLVDCPPLPDQSLALYRPAEHRPLAAGFGHDTRVKVLCWRA